MNKHLLQSEEWKEFQESLGRKAFRADFGNVFEYDLPFGMKYLYSPRIKEIKNIDKKNDAIFLRIDSEENIDPEELKKLGFVKAKKEVQPKDTLILDITQSEEKILKQMHHKARYNIRLSSRKGVTVRQSVDSADVDKFYDLMTKTTERDGFSAHLKEYYQKQVEILGKKDIVKLFLAEYEGKTIAAIIVSFYSGRARPPSATPQAFAGRATYLHGASDIEYRKVMAPQLLQWEAIKEAKKRGCVEYDFWGIAPSNAADDHAWSGITRFKRGFGGEERNYIGAWDYVFKPFWYRLYNMFSK